MSTETTGIHHVTAIAREPRRDRLEEVLPPLRVPVVDSK
jgi:hypothetical protein